MDRQRLVGQIGKTWASFQSSYEGLTPAQMEEPGVTGDWSVKDILAHVTTWEQEALEHLPHIIAGERPARYKDLYGGIDAFNDQMAARKRGFPLDQVLRELEATHRRLLDFIAAAPDEQFASETRSRRRIRWDTYSHYPHHEKAIREWRARIGV